MWSPNILIARLYFKEAQSCCCFLSSWHRLQTFYMAMQNFYLQGKLVYFNADLTLHLIQSTENFKTLHRNSETIFCKCTNSGQLIY